MQNVNLAHVQWPSYIQPYAIMTLLKYLNGYSNDTIEQVKQVIAEQRLADILLKKYPHAHMVRNDSSLYQYTMDLKNQFMSKAQPLNKVAYDGKIKVMEHALGQHHYINRVQGGKIKSVNEIKIASLFRTAPEAFLKMIVVHELVLTSN